MTDSSESVISDMKSVIRSSNELQSVSFNRSAEIRGGAKNRNREVCDDDDDEAAADDSNDVIEDRMVALAAQIK
jgi:hypothetical protein